VDDGQHDPLHLVVEIKSYRREDAKDKKATMETYWVPGVNNLGRFGYWAFAEFTEVYQIEFDFKARIEAEFNKIVDSAIGQPTKLSGVIIEKARAYLLQQFGEDSKWMKLNTAIWQLIEFAPDHALRLSDIDTLTEKLTLREDEILAALALLSRPSIRILKLELRSEKEDEAELDMTVFINKLKDWWKRKRISEEEWRHWSSNISVRWIPVLLREYNSE